MPITNEQANEYYERWKNPSLSIIGDIVKAEMAMDIYHNAWVTAVAKWDTCRNESARFAWFWTIVRNTAYTYVRYSQVRKRHAMEEVISDAEFLDRMKSDYGSGASAIEAQLLYKEITSQMRPQHVSDLERYVAGYRAPDSMDHRSRGRNVTRLRFLRAKREALKVATKRGGGLYAPVTNAAEYETTNQGET